MRALLSILLFSCTAAAATPITAPPNRWTWVDVPEAVCGNGTPTGIGINPGGPDADLLIYLEGGGACWNATTCFDLESADHIRTGYGAADFASDFTILSEAFSRSVPQNPFRAVSFVVVPYCTGDVHAGDAAQTYGTRGTVQHRGRKNIAAYLARLAVTFPNVKRVFLTGSSAGAFGAQLNYQQVAAAFPHAQTHVLADSGQMLNPSPALLTAWKKSWNLVEPRGCDGCFADFSRVPAFLATTYPQSRFGLLAFTRDATLRGFFQLDANSYEAKTRALLTDRYDGHLNAKYFALDSPGHVMLGELMQLKSKRGVSLANWVAAWMAGTDGFTNVAP